MDRSSRNIKLLKSKNIGIGNENILPGKNVAPSLSKIPTRSVLGTVNGNALPEKKPSEFVKPIAPDQTSSLLKKTALSTKFSSASNTNQQNILQNSSILKTNVPALKKSLLTDRTSIPKPSTILKAPIKQTNPRVPFRSDSTASIHSTRPEKSKTQLSLDIIQCELDLTNVSLEEDIDSADQEDPYLLGCYVKDIYNYLFQLEKAFPIRRNYLEAHVSIIPKYRTVLVNYMVDMQVEYNLFPETLFLAVFMLDKYLELEPGVTKSNLQCVGVTALFLASKFEEIMIPDIREFASMTDDYVKVNDILSMEVLMAQKLNFNFNRPQPLAFLRRFSKVAKADRNCHHFAKYFIELGIIEYSVVHEPPSKIAAAALYLAHIADKPDITNFWTKILVHYCRYTEEDILPVVRQLARALVANRGPKSPYRAVRDKYAKTANLRVSLSESLTAPCATIKALAAAAPHNNRTSPASGSL